MFYAASSSFYFCSSVSKFIFENFMLINFPTSILSLTTFFLGSYVFAFTTSSVFLLGSSFTFL
jgi:hypothetical protein